MPKKLCNYSGCNETAVEHHIYCEKHLAESQKKHEEFLENRKQAFANAKRTNTSLYNTQRWRNLRKKVLSEYCYCEKCGATKEDSGFPLEIHHRTPPKGNEELFFMEGNLMVLCKRCHAAITAYETQETRNAKKNFLKSLLDYN